MGGTPSQVISLPQGGGALHGIGEKFSPDLHTGTGNFTTPIALPPGRNGFQPQLNLVYSTGTGNGPFGLGWNLSIPGVSRKTAKGVPRYDDATDVFILSGSEDLVPVPAPPGAPQGRTYYRPRTEGLFARIAHRRDATNDYWEVRSKDGLVSYYGTPRPAGAPPDWRDLAVIRDPAQNRAGRIFAWKLTRTLDLFGNRIDYIYSRDAQPAEGAHRWDQLYLSEIRYADYGGDRENPEFLVRVRFTCKERPDQFSDYRAGFEIRTKQRCTRIDVLTGPDPGVLSRHYDLVYLDQRDRPPAARPRNGVSLLSRINVVGHDRDETEVLPPLEFGYTRFEPESPEGRSFFPLRGTDLPPVSLAHPDYELVDLFGNGLPSILEMNGTVRYWRNRGGGRFDLPREMGAAPAQHLADLGVQLLDANGDGRADLLVSAGGLAGYYPLRIGGLWDRRSFQSYRQAPGFNLKDPEVRLLDLDGDGVTDALRSGSRLECFFHDPKDGWNNTRQVERPTGDGFPGSFADPRVKWADMSGDGLQDLVLVHDGSVEYWPNLGYGTWGPRVQTQHSPRFPYGHDPKRILAGDLDGDGLADLVYVDDTRITLWTNQSGRGWSDPIVIRGTPPVSDMDSVRLADVLGTGVAGILWTTDAGGPSRERMWFLDLTGGAKPYLLHEMDNHMGGVTRVEYAPSTKFYLEDERRRETRWKTPLPFPVQVVARVEVIDDLSKGKLTTEYRYHHGYWDGAEREFRGFGMVEQLDTETFERYARSGLHGPGTSFQAVDREHFSPPTLTKTWFHQGPVGEEFGDWQEQDWSDQYWQGDPQLLGHTESVNDFLKGIRDRRVKRDALRTLRGSILRTELYARDGSDREDRPYTVTEHAYGLREEATPAAIFFPHALAQRTTQWERGDDPMTQFSFTGDYDEFGQPREQTAVALPRRSARRHQVVGAVVGAVDVEETRILATHTRTEYAVPDASLDPELYVHDRVAQARTFELAQPPGVSEGAPGDLARVLEDGADAAAGVHQQFQDLLKPWRAGQPLPEGLRLVGHTLNHYDGPGFAGGDVGTVGPYGVLTRVESLVFTDADLTAAYGVRRPSYLGGSASLPPGAPPGFGSDLGYRRESLSAVYHAGYYANTKRQQADVQSSSSPQQRGFVLALQDPLGHQVDILPDSYWLLPAQVTDAVGLRTKATYDYRVMQPARVIDANDNATRYTYSVLGLLGKVILEGRAGEGGTEAKPEIEYAYDFLNYERTRGQPQPQPVFVHTRQRTRHASENASDEVIESREYSDGVGRLIQKRAQAEDLTFGGTGDDVGLAPEPGGARGPAVGGRVADRVVVSGWQVYDNKGRVVEKYELLFATGWPYQPEAEAKQGRHATLFYDPRGQLIRTVNPDGSEQRVIFGIPPALNDPDRFTPSPWERYTYDPNDLAPLSFDPLGRQPGGSPNPLTGRAPAAHHFTPASAVLDALGRVRGQVERNGAVPAQDWFLTRSEYDVRGNLLTVTDPLGRPAFRHAYDLQNRRLRVDSIDAGLRTSVLDAAGSLAEYRDSKGSVTLRQYDPLNRLTHLWARDDPGPGVTLREQLIYGGATDRNANRAGRLYEHHDEAGLLRFEQYDFKGNLTQKTRQVVSDAALAAGWVANWSAPGSENALDATIYRTSTRFDALNRTIEVRCPADPDGHVAVLEPHYNRAGALDRVVLDGAPYVTRIGYNAKGQRVLIAYGNRVMTRYAYDPDTFRLIRLRAEPCQDPAPPSDTWTATGAVLQELTYAYDLAGNITSIEDRTPDCGVAGSAEGRDRLVRRFSYDPLYRLTSADGRSCRDIPVPRPFEDLARCGAYPPPYVPSAPTPTQRNAPDLTERYTEAYAYDPAGNLLTVSYTAGSGGWTRSFGLGGLPPDQWAQASNNRLTSVTQGTDTHSHQYDANGNLEQQNTERRLGWDHADRLIRFIIQPAGAPRPSVEARYLYGAAGARVKKWVRDGTGAESSVYLDGLFEHHRWQEAGQPKQNAHVHVMDNRQRVALVRSGAAHPKDAGPPIQYHLGDHLGSSAAVIDDTGTWINREEFFPYGETSFGSFARKRYRSTGKERDEETGLYYHGLRYYCPWVARWASTDPLIGNGTTLYVAFRDNPSLFGDSTGASDDISGTPPTQEELQQTVTPPLTKDPIAGYTGGATTAPVDQPPRQPPVDPFHAMWEDFAGAPLTPAGLRTDRDASQPRAAYVNPHALNAALSGHTKWADVVEAGLTCTACHLTIPLGRTPTNDELDLDRLNLVATVTAKSRDALDTLLSIVRHATAPRPTTTGRPASTVQQNSRVGAANRDMAELSMRRAGIPFTSGGERTLKNAAGTSARATSAQTRKPDEMLHGENNVRSGLELKASDTPTTRREAARELKNENEIIRAGAYWEEDDQLLPVVKGQGTGVAFGWWHVYPPPKGTKN